MRRCLELAAHRRGEGGEELARVREWVDLLA